MRSSLDASSLSSNKISWKRLSCTSNWVLIIGNWSSQTSKLTFNATVVFLLNSKGESLKRRVNVWRNQKQSSGRVLKRAAIKRCGHCL